MHQVVENLLGRSALRRVGCVGHVVARHQPVQQRELGRRAAGTVALVNKNVDPHLLDEELEDFERRAVRSIRPIPRDKRQQRHPALAPAFGIADQSHHVADLQNKVLVAQDTE